jgi:CysZ protein
MQRLLVLNGKALSSLLKNLVHGRYIIYFLPGIMISAFFFGLEQEIVLYWEYFNWLSKAPFLGAYLGVANEMMNTLVGGVYLFLFHFLAVSCLSPLHTFFSGAIAKDLKEEATAFSWELIVNDLVRTIGVIVLGGLYYLFLKSIWMLLSSSFSTAIIDATISFLLISFFIGYNAFDYSMERHGVSVLRSWKFSYSKISYVLFVGIVFSGLLMLPYIGFVIAPLFATYIATFCYHQLEAN